MSLTIYLNMINQIGDPKYISTNILDITTISVKHETKLFGG